MLDTWSSGVTISSCIIGSIRMDSPASINWNKNFDRLARLSLLSGVNFSIGDKPLEYWSKKQSRTGRIRKVLDTDLLEDVIEIQDLEQCSVPGTSISCPFEAEQFLQIKLPILVIVMKSTNAQWRIQLQIKDTDGIRHHFRFSSTGIENNVNIRAAVISRIQVKLQSGWNKLELNLAQLTRSAFRSSYEATQKLEICANCRLRRVYFLDKHYEDSDVSTELCQGFLDFYMLKWGIHLVDRATQTDKIIFKVSPFDPTADVKDGVRKKLMQNSPTRKEFHKEIVQNDSSIDSQFINIIQVKSCRLIDNFFSKIPTQLPFAFDLKQKFKAKPYFTPVPPTLQPRQLLANKLLTRNLEKHWLSYTDENFPKTVEDFYEKFFKTSTSQEYEFISKDENQQDKRKQENTQEEWIHRYMKQSESNCKLQKT